MRAFLLLLYVSFAEICDKDSKGTFLLSKGLYGLGTYEFLIEPAYTEGIVEFLGFNVMDLGLNSFTEFFVQMVFDQTKTEASLEYNFLLQAIGNGEVILQ